jgi:hypothetical protein
MPAAVVSVEIATGLGFLGIGRSALVSRVLGRGCACDASRSVTWLVFWWEWWAWMLG